MSSTATTIDEVARVYARSIFELADEAGGEEKIHEIGDELEALAEIVRSDKEIGEFFRSPIIDTLRRSETLKRVFNDEVSDLVLRFLLVLNEKDRLGRLDDVADAFTEFAHVRFGRIEVDVFTTSGAVESSQLKQLGERIKSRLGREPVFHQYVDNNMIGGLVLRIGDELIDGSVRGRLRRMREELRKEGSKAVREAPERFLQEND
jgi:F-type H+-transporting ATPase subunit delta